MKSPDEEPSSGCTAHTRRSKQKGATPEGLSQECVLTSRLREATVVGPPAKGAPDLEEGQILGQNHLPVDPKG